MNIGHIEIMTELRDALDKAAYEMMEEGAVYADITADEAIRISNALSEIIEPWHIHILDELGAADLEDCIPFTAESCGCCDDCVGIEYCLEVEQYLGDDAA